MTNEERDLITQFITRVGGGAQSARFSSVPSGGGNASLPPVDRDADALIQDLFNRNPEARYRITQLAFVQEHALAAAQNKISELTNALSQAQQAAPQPSASPWGQGAAAAPAQPQSRGILSSIFGGNSPQPPRQPQYAPPPQQYAPQPQYAPQMPQQMMAQQGTGFLGGALRTAAGVAGGVVAGNALMSMFSGHSGGGMFGGGGLGAPTSFGDAAAGGAAGGWLGGAGGSGADPMDQGGAMKDDGSSGIADNSGWTTPDQGGGGWTDTSNVADNSGGWTDTSNSDTGGGWDDTSNSDNT